MKHLLVIILINVSIGLHAQDKFDSVETAFLHFKAYYRLLDGKNYKEENYVFTKKTYYLLGSAIFEFNCINKYNFKKSIYIRILETKELLHNEFLYHAIFDTNENSMSIIDSILHVYLNTTDIDSLIPHYFYYNKKVERFKNYPLSPYNTCIIAFGNKYSIFYKLLGYETNDFRSFYYKELLPKLNLNSSQSSKEKYILNELNELHFEPLQLKEMYLSYVKRKSRIELYPIECYKFIR